MRRGRLWLWLGQLYLFALLFVFKYLGLFSLTHSLILPVGISFYTFSASAYLFDVYRGKVQAETDFVSFALFLSFFPSILSGPINRAQALLPQIRECRSFDSLCFRQGLLRFSVGAVKKTVLADTLAIFTGSVYADIPSQTPSGLLLAVLLYSLQIYFDFAGYTDMALGAAKMLGFTLPENFRAPYLVRSVKEFWKRWHISLTSWFRDYLYFPLGGSRVPKARTYLNILIVFAVSGIWHGAGLSFLVWGLLNGVYQVLGLMLDPARKKLHRNLHIREDSRLLALVQCGFTYVLISLAWVFFRADGIGDAVYIIKNLLLLPSSGLLYTGILSSLSSRQIVLCAVLILVFTVQDFCLVSGKHSEICRTSLPYWLCLACIAAVLCIFGVYGVGFDAQDFVYFRF